MSCIGGSFAKTADYFWSIGLKQFNLTHFWNPQKKNWCRRTKAPKKNYRHKK